MKEEGCKRPKLFLILIIHLSYQWISKKKNKNKKKKNTEERELVSEVNYVSVAFVDSDVIKYL